MGFLACMRPLDSLLGSLRGCLDRFADKRRGINTTYGIGDIGMASPEQEMMKARLTLRLARVVLLSAYQIPHWEGP